MSAAIELVDTTIGWRFVNPKLNERYPTISLGETAERVAQKWNVSREDQDAFALASQQRAAVAENVHAEEIVPVHIPQRTGAPVIVDRDEHPRHDTNATSLARLKPAFSRDGSVTAGNASGINDGAAALLVVEAERARAIGLTPYARIVATAVAGVDPSVMGIGPVPAIKKLLARTGLTVADLDCVELAPQRRALRACRHVRRRRSGDRPPCGARRGIVPFCRVGGRINGRSSAACWHA